MKTRCTAAKLIGLGLVFALHASLTQAGEAPQSPNRAVAAAKEETPPVKRDDAMACAACKTVTLRKTKWVGPAGKTHLEWFDVGTKHSCAHCGGEFRVVDGVMTNSMKANCTLCGKDAALCSAAIQTPAAKP